jgi:phosphatidylserine synthase
VVATTQWFASWVRSQGAAFDIPEPVVAGGVATLGLLMVSGIPYRSFKELDLRHSFGTLVVVVLGLIVIVQEPSVTLFACGLAYTAHGPVEWLWRRASGRRLEEAEPPAHDLPGVSHE